MSNDKIRLVHTTPVSGSQLCDDLDLLNLIIKGGTEAPAHYRPGPYWENSTKSSKNELKRCGIADFRGSTCGAATGFSDCLEIDRRHTTNYGLRGLLNKITGLTYPLNRVYDSQVSLTSSYLKELVVYKKAYFQSHPRVLELTRSYQINLDTTKGGDNAWVEIEGRQLSLHYLEILSTLDFISRDVPLLPTTKYLEIGGGFGVNVHLLIELFGVMKIIYVDIAPNLYLGTQYLKSFYGAAVIDYRDNRNNRIAFHNDSELEIICILPEQIESIDSEIDVFHNAHSFVEMPEPVVENYAKVITKLMPQGNSHISLVSYDGFDLSTTFHPDQILKHFVGQKSEKQFSRLIPGRFNFHYTITF